MAICKSCGVAQASFLSDLCGKCIDAPSQPVSRSPPQNSQVAGGDGALTEGDYTTMIGQGVIWLSIASAAICSFAFGQVEVATGLYSTEKVWNTTLVGLYVASGVNGVFFGYLLSKIGSVLKRLDRPNGAA